MSIVASYVPIREQARLALVNRSLNELKNTNGISPPSFAPLIESHATVVQQEHFNTAVTTLGPKNEFLFISTRAMNDKVEITVVFDGVKQFLSRCEPRNFKKILYRMIMANKPLHCLGGLGAAELFEVLGACEGLDDVIEMDGVGV